MRQDRNSASGKARESYDSGEAEALWALGRPDGAAYVAPKAEPAGPAELLVQFKPGSAASQAALVGAAGGDIASVVRSDANGDLLVITVRSGHAASTVMAALQNNPLIDYVESNALLAVQGSNEPRYVDGKMWGMYGDQTATVNKFGSQAGEAWAAGHTGKSSTVIGVIDTGIDYTHPDLFLNIWLNPGEIPKNLGLVDTDKDGLITFRDLNSPANTHAVSDINGNGRIDAGDLLNDIRWENGIDNDGNGRVDDLIGWNFRNNTNDPMDGGGHGTHVAGTIGAMGNNGYGVAGVNWAVQLMALKFLPDSGTGSMSHAIQAIEYYTAAAKAHDAGPGNYVATNNSWGDGYHSYAMLQSIVNAAKQDVLFIAAAGNGGSDKKGDNNDLTPNYPSSYSTLAAAGWEAVVSVASITSTGARSGFSNYGLLNVDLGAPGTGIMSTTPNGGYASYSGTSMATPHVTGGIGLLASTDQSLSGAELRALLLDTTTTTTSMALTSSGGRLNIADLLAAGAPQEAAAPPAGPAPAMPPGKAGISLFGTSKSDVLVGGDGNDIISGIPAAGTHLGRGTVDRLTGGGGNDLFILGDERGGFYGDGNTKAPGHADRAVITDFSEGDRVQLAAGPYLLRAASIGGDSGTGIFFDSNSDGQWNSGDELVGLVMGPKTFTHTDIVFG